MSISTSERRRPAELAGRYVLRGQYRMCVSTGAVTVIAAKTGTAGFLFAFRWGSSTGVKAFVRYVGARFILTTGYTAAQETGCDLIMLRAYTASHGGGTAIDTGGTVTSTGELMTSQLVSLVTSARVASTTALTGSTFTIDANPMSIVSDWSSAAGDTIPRSASEAHRPAVLWDARADESPLVLAQDEGFAIRNQIVMGAVGVGRWDFTIEWDEGTV